MALYGIIWSYIDRYMYVYIYINLGESHNDLTDRPSPGNHRLRFGESSPFMGELFRLVNHSNLPRF